jgi:hypothetical protein
MCGDWSAKQTTAPVPKNIMKATIENGDLVVRMPMTEPTPSKATGKTLMVANSGGAVNTGLLHPVSKQPIRVNLMAYFYPPKPVGAA